MKNSNEERIPFFRKNWWLIAIISILILSLPLILTKKNESTQQKKYQKQSDSHDHVNHADIVKGPFTDGPSVTKECLTCHPDAAGEVMQTTHWTWQTDSISIPGREEKAVFGKRTGFNNFCIAVSGGNWEKCTSCHIGYGWKDDEFDFKNKNLVDCLSCHDQSGSYGKGLAGIPKKESDLLAAAKSVGRPTRENCGACHFKGGGGNAVKHGDLDESLYHPSENLDVHMGRHKMQCVDCHKTSHHQISGRSMSVNVSKENRLSCTDCHQEKPHNDDRLDKHAKNISCQTCHIPEVAKKEATKTNWDWSTAGQDIPEDKHKYLKIKGSFLYQKELIPEYYWYNGESSIYVKGDSINSEGVTDINHPHGDIKDMQAKIHPFKVHRATQIYDKINKYLIPPRTVGPGGYWTDFDWQKAAEMGAKTAGLAYSGEYDFTETQMYWPLDHMVSVKEKALQCTDCHSQGGRMNWEALGYAGDPMIIRETREDQ